MIPFRYRIQLAILVGLIVAVLLLTLGVSTIATIGGAGIIGGCFIVAEAITWLEKQCKR